MIWYIIFLYVQFYYSCCFIFLKFHMFCFCERIYRHNFYIWFIFFCCLLATFTYFIYCILVSNFSIFCCFLFHVVPKERNCFKFEKKKRNIQKEVHWYLVKMMKFHRLYRIIPYFKKKINNKLSRIYQFTTFWKW